MGKIKSSEIDFSLLPNFFLIGAAKAGTTSLFDMLIQHEEIYGPPEKETGFFNNNKKYQKGIGWYQKTYFKNAKGYPVRCDATPAYLIWSGKVSQRIQYLYRQKPVKFAAIFRDPVQQAYSHYWQRVRQGVEDLPFAEALAAEEERLKEYWDELEWSGNGKYGYFRAGCYATRLLPFLDKFSRECFFFLRHEDLQQDNKIRLTGLLEFLDINESSSLVIEHSNKAMMPKNHRVYALLRRFRKTFTANLLRKLISSQNRDLIRDKLNDHLLVPYPYPPMDKKVEVDLRDRYAQEVWQLEKITGWDLSLWLPHENINQVLP